MTYKLKRQIVNKIHKLNDPDAKLLKIIARLLGLKVDEQKKRSIEQ